MEGLTRMETEFVFDYLKNNNVPIVVKVFDKNEVLKEFKITSIYLHFFDYKIFFQNDSFLQHCGKKISVNFEFKKLPVYFFSTLKRQNKNVFVIQPKQIFSEKSDIVKKDTYILGRLRIEEVEICEYECFLKSLNILKINKPLLEASELEDTKPELLEIIYWQNNYMVFAGEKNIFVPQNAKCSIQIKFPLKSENIFRLISANLIVEKTYLLGEKKCFKARILNLKKEDERFLSDLVQA